MKIYWTFKSVPEVVGLSKGERKRLWRNCYPKAYRHWQTWVTSIAMVIFFALFGIHVLLLDELSWLGSYPWNFTPLEEFLLNVLVFFVVCGLAFIHAIVVLNITRPYLRKERQLEE